MPNPGSLSPQCSIYLVVGGYCPRDLLDRVRGRLTALDAAQALRELDLPGWGLHKLQGEPVRYALSVNGPWRITFEWEDGDAFRVGLEQYH